MPYKKTYKRKRTYYRNPGRKTMRKIARIQYGEPPVEVTPLNATQDVWTASKYGPNNYQIREAYRNNNVIRRSSDQTWKRYADNYWGMGDYRDWLKYGSRLGGAAIGAARGFATGGVGGAVSGIAPGWQSGASFSKQMGWGDYNTPAVANQIVGKAPSSAVTPAIVNPSGDLSGDVYMYHREFIGNVTVNGTAGSSTGFENRVYELNPGLKETFPFLAQLASNFELYQFEGLMFQYVPTYGESSSTSNNLGKVIMATNYDPAASNFTSSVQMQNYDYSNSCKPSLGQVHGVETDPTKRATDMMYVREGDSSRDKVFTDIGSFQLATEGIPLGTGATSAIIGELWVTYRIRLSRAHLNDFFDTTRHYGYNIDGAGALTLVTKTEPTISVNFVALDIHDVTVTSLNPEKEYLVQFDVNTELTLVTNQINPTITNGAFVQRSWLHTGLADFLQLNKAVTESRCGVTYVFKPTSDTAILRFDAVNALDEGDTAINFFISEIPPL